MLQNFNEKLGIDGVILTKLDGEIQEAEQHYPFGLSRKKPIKFAGMGEKLDDLEFSIPIEWLLGILGMGDVLTLIEKAQANFDEKKPRN